MKIVTRISPSTITDTPVDLRPRRLVISAGPTLNSITAKPIEIANAKTSWPRESSVLTSPSAPSSCDAYWAEIARARKPIASDSPSAMTPRMIGRRKIRRFAIGDVIGLQTCAIAPSGLRTATARLDGLRIITPSRTACPPTVIEEGSLALVLAGTLEPALEALHAAAGVDELLLARIAG